MTASYRLALTSTKTPTVICCSRSTVKGIKESTVDKALMGAYAALSCDDPKLIIVATGSEVGICIDAAEKLTKLVLRRVLSMPCQEVFLQQSAEYQKSILPATSQPCQSKLLP
jgi:transketolase